MTLEKSLQAAKNRARSLEPEEKRRFIYSREHVATWQGHKVGSPLLKQPTPNFLVNFLGEAKVQEHSLDTLKTDVIAQLIG